MTTIRELYNKPIKDITADDLQNLVISESDKIHISRCHYPIFINGKTMERSSIDGTWIVSFDLLRSVTFYFDNFFDMPKSLQDLWIKKTGDTEPELKHD